MKPTTDDLATRFLSSELSEEERQAVEQRFLTDNQFFEEVLAAESALVDQYLLGRLTGAERDRAKSLFESSRYQRQTLESSKELLNLVRQADHQSLNSANQPDIQLDQANKSQAKESVTNSFGKQGSEHLIPIIPLDLRTSRRLLICFGALSLALVCVALVAVIAYFHSEKKAWDVTRVALEKDRLTANEQLRVETRRREQIARQLEIEMQKRISTEELVAELRPHFRNRPIPVFLTPAGIERAHGANVVTVKMGPSRILQLELDPNWQFSRYGVLLTTFDGAKISTPDSLDSSHIKQGNLELLVPGSSLKAQDYKIALSGLSDSQDPVHLADYVFKVRK